MGSFTADGQLQSQSWPDGSRQDFAWEKGRLKQISLPDQSRIALGAYQWLIPGQIELPAGARITQKPDAFQRLAQLQVTRAQPQGAGANAAQLLQRRYSRNPAGHITRIESEEGASAYTYDRLGRLTQAEPDQALQDKGLPGEAYSWDAAGNRLSSAHQAGAWTYNQANQLLQYPRALDENAPAQQSQTEQVSASYNAQGHLIKETGAGWERNWRYNAAGRLSEIKDSADGLTVQNRYDPFGRRIAKTVTQGATSRTTYYINGESALMAEADEEGRITRAYGFNPHTQQARANEEDEDEQEGSLWSTDPIWQADLAAGQSLKEASYHYLVTDHLGTPVLALNKAGETTWKANYEAFGKARINPASTAQINLRLPGQYFDAETGLHQNWNRDYAPGIGRYVQADPIGLAGGVNVYLYANGNPKRYIDDTAKLFLDLTTFVSAQREVTLGEAVERGKLTRTVTLPMLMLALSSPVIVTATSTVKTTGASGIYVCKKAAEWYMRGAENDIYWQNLSWKDKLYYEIGQKTTRDYIRYSSMGIVARGRAIVKDKGWIKALIPETGGVSLGLGVGTFRTGPTPAGRWFMSRTAAGITAFTVIGSIPSDSSSCFCEEK